MTQPQERIQIALGYPTSLIYMDESGVSTNTMFVMGALKVRGHGGLARSIRSSPRASARQSPSLAWPMWW